jgi:hypothetical protein
MLDDMRKLVLCLLALLPALSSAARQSYKPFTGSYNQIGFRLIFAVRLSARE